MSCVICCKYSTWKLLVCWLYVQSGQSYRCDPYGSVSCMPEWGDDDADASKNLVVLTINKMLLICMYICLYICCEFIGFDNKLYQMHGTDTETILIFLSTKDFLRATTWYGEQDSQTTEFGTSLLRWVSNCLWQTHHLRRNICEEI